MFNHLWICCNFSFICVYPLKNYDLSLETMKTSWKCLKLYKILERNENWQIILLCTCQHSDSWPQSPPTFSITFYTFHHPNITPVIGQMDFLVSQTIFVISYAPKNQFHAIFNFNISDIGSLLELFWWDLELAVVNGIHFSFITYHIGRVVYIQG